MTTTSQTPSLHLQRIYSLPDYPYAQVEFIERTVLARGKDLREITVIAPAAWTQNAVDVLVQKYLRRAGVPSDVVRIAEDGVPEWLQRREPAPGATFGAETDARQAFSRLAGAWTYYGWKYGYFVDEAQAKLFFEELQAMIAMQIASPNSPQWFNTGLHWAYGIAGEAQGHYFADPLTKTVSASKNSYEQPSVAACYIQSYEDDLLGANGIFDGMVREARIFKQGSGVGANFSRIRGAGEPLSAGGSSSGLMSFLKVLDRGAGAIKSGGTTRRAAKMVILDLDHPEIEEFINWKAREERKVENLIVGSITMEAHLNALMTAAHDASINETQRFDVRTNPQLARAASAALQARIPKGSILQTIAYAKQGFTSIDVELIDASWEGEGYNTVSGQNSNNSVRIPNRFFEALDRGDSWALIARTNGAVIKELAAQSLWEQIGNAAWRCADPGVQFDDLINEWNTCLNDDRIRGTNPCSEFCFLDNSQCNLASINLVKFLDGQSFDAERFACVVQFWTIVLDISSSMGQAPSELIARTDAQYRTLGLGYANLGALLMRMAMPYGSKAACDWTGAITALLTGVAYKTSADLAEMRGAFPAFARNREHVLRVLNNHRVMAEKKPQELQGVSAVPPIALSEDIAPIWPLVRAFWSTACEQAQLHGVANAQVTCIAPTGTIGIQMSADTTGIEPDYALVKDKKLAGGGTMRIVNESVAPALARLGYTPLQIEDILRYAIGTNALPAAARAALMELNVNDDTLREIEDGLASAFSLELLLQSHVDLQALRNIVSPSTLAAWGQEACGSRTLEGAPHLAEEHLAVFDCATPCGRIGMRYISADAHLDILAAAQPFLSGASSKTVNMPESASVQDILRIYRRAWELGIKCLAVYRENSKLSAVLSGSDVATQLDDLKAATAPISLEEKTDVLLRGMQKKLKRRRSGYTQSVDIGGHKVYLRTGEYENGALGEIFIDMSKEGSAFRAMMNHFAQSISVGLQYGVPLEEYVKMFTFTRFEPNGPIVGHNYLKNCTSILDAIFRDLAITYLDQFELAHVQPDLSASTVGTPDEQGRPQTALHPQNGHVSRNGNPTAVKESELLSARAIAVQSGFTGDACADCGQLKMVRNGTCLKCTECGAASGGCS